MGAQGQTREWRPLPACPPGPSTGVIQAAGLALCPVPCALCPGLPLSQPPEDLSRLPAENLCPETERQAPSQSGRVPPPAKAQRPVDEESLPPWKRGPLQAEGRPRGCEAALLGLRRPVPGSRRSSAPGHPQTPAHPWVGPAVSILLLWTLPHPWVRSWSARSKCGRA